MGNGSGSGSGSGLGSGLGKGLAAKDRHSLSGEAAAKRRPAADYSPAEDYDEILAFLSKPETYEPIPQAVEVLETHMSMVFLVGKRVYKLKRPIKLDFLDFRTLDARRESCATEVAINQALAPGAYLQTLPVMRTENGTLALGGKGDVREWLVVMRRLDSRFALDRLVEKGAVTQHDLDRLCDRLAKFYRNQTPIDLSPDWMMAHWRDRVELDAASLADPLFALPAELVEPPIAELRRFLERDAELIKARLSAGRIIDGHGDLKPEHVFLGPDEVLFIDRLEFDERLRWCDPFDEISFLGMECSRLGMPDILPGLIDRLAARLDDRPPEPLLRFYLCHRACLRARLSIEHLRDEDPQTPEKWPRQTRAYLRLAGEALPLSD